MDLTKLKELFPYYQKGNVIIFNADSRELLPLLPKASFDLILTDPPYGIGYAFYDNSSEVFFEIEKELFRITQPNAFLVFWWSTKNLLNVNRFKLFTYHHLIIAQFYSTKSKTVVGDRKYTPVFVFKKGNPKINRRYADMIPTGELPIVEGKILSGDFKPTLSLTQLLFMFSDENSLILDPFAGYGSLPLVCSVWNRRCIAIEKDKTRFEVAKKLLKEGKLSRPIPELEKEVGIKRLSHPTLW